MSSNYTLLWYPAGQIIREKQLGEGGSKIFTMGGTVSKATVTSYLNSALYFSDPKLLFEFNV